MAIRVLIVDDHHLFRRGLREACEAQAGLVVVGDADNGQRAVELVGQLRPDVVLMDIQMPLMDGVQATRLITHDYPDTRVIMLTVFQDDEYVFEALKAGACGYLLKDVEEEKLLQAVRTVYEGGGLMNTRIAARVLEEFRRLSHDLQPEPAAEELLAQVEDLTPAEMEVLRLVAQGKDNGEIAVQLRLSDKTIANRVSTIYQKLQVNNRVQAALYALRRGWVDL